MDLNRVCRTCSAVNENNSPYGNALIYNNEPTELCYILDVLTSIKFISVDGLPQTICDKCCEQLRSLQAFKEQCERVNTSLKLLLSEEKTQEVNELIPENVNLKNQCKDCLQLFDSPYMLYKHIITHDQNKTLTEQYFSTRNEKFDAVKVKPNKKIIALLEQRKHGEFQKKINNDFNVLQTEDIVIVNNELCLEKTINSDVKNIEQKKHGELQKKINNDFNVLQTENIIIVNNECYLEETINSEVKNVKMCDLCGKCFSDSLLLSLHFLKHASYTNNNSFQTTEHYFFCKYCGIIFDNNENLNNHVIENHQNENQENNFDNQLLDNISDKEDVEKNCYNCPLCEETFTFKDELHKHSLIHLLKKYKCPVCKVLFINEISFNEHMKSHPKYKYECSVCGKRFTSNGILKNHTNEVHKDKNISYSCNICNKIVKTKSGLINHKKRHTSVKRYLCSKCNYSTNDMSDLQIHSRVHSKERPYKCLYSNCTKSFKTASQLAGHSRSHLKIRKYKCTICAGVFSHSNTLKKHYMQHTGEKPFSCVVCDSKFRRKDHLNLHMRRHERIVSDDV